MPPVRDGVPDAEVETQEQAAEDPAVAGVERAPVVVGAERAGGGGGEEARDIVAVLVSEIAEDTEHGGRAVELRESSAEAAVGDDAAPGLADEGGAEEARGIRRREAEEDLLHELLQQHHAAWCLLRRSPVRRCRRAGGARVLVGGESEGRASERAEKGTVRNCGLVGGIAAATCVEIDEWALEYMGRAGVLFRVGWAVLWPRGGHSCLNNCVV